MEQYEKIRLLGQGSYGTAYLVRDRTTGRRGANRVLKEVDLGRMSTSMREDARAEVDVLSALQHVNVVAYYASFFHEASSKLCIVMEFADGGDLAATIKTRRAEAGRFSEDEALGIFVQCCLALHHIHSKHILHRDLKSQNIFLTKAGVVKIGDFGIAKVLECTAAEAVTVIGTPANLAPEVCDRRPYGIKADVWSLGVVLYELLALEAPFQGPGLAALAVKIVTCDPKPLPCDYSEDLRAVVDVCLTKQPELRPKTAELLSSPAAKVGIALLPPPVAESLRRSGVLPQTPSAARGAGPASRGSAAEASPTTATAVESDRLPAKRFEHAAEPRGIAGGDAVDDLLGGHLPPRPGVSKRPPKAQPAQQASQGVFGAADFGGGGGLSAAAVRERAREERETAEQAHRRALQEAAAQARRDRKAVQSKMQELEKGSQQPAVVAVPEVVAPARPVPAADGDAVSSVRQRAQAAKEEQRRQREADLERARLEARAAQREMRALRIDHSPRLDVDIGGLGKAQPPTAAKAEAPPPVARGAAAPADSSNSSAPSAPSAPLSARGPRGGHFGRVGVMIGGGGPAPGAGSAAGAVGLAQRPTTCEVVTTAGAAEPEGRQGLADSLNSALLGVLGDLGATQRISDDAAPAADATLLPQLLRGTLPRTSNSTIENQQLLDELSRLCVSNAATLQRPCSRSASKSAGMDADSRLQGLGDSWRAAQEVTDPAGGTLEYSFSNDFETLGSSGRHVGAAF